MHHVYMYMCHIYIYTHLNILGLDAELLRQVGELVRVEDEDAERGVEEALNIYTYIYIYIERER